MDHFGGLDVSVKETSICIVDDTGRIVKEVKVASEPAALLKVLGNPTYRFKRIGLEAGPLSQWLFSALAEADIVRLARHVRKVRQPKAELCTATTPSIPSSMRPSSESVTMIPVPSSKPVSMSGPPVWRLEILPA